MTERLHDFAEAPTWRLTDDVGLTTVVGEPAAVAILSRHALPMLHAETPQAIRRALRAIAPDHTITLCRHSISRCLWP